MPWSYIMNCHFFSLPQSSKLPLSANMRGTFMYITPLFKPQLRTLRSRPRTRPARHLLGCLQHFGLGQPRGHPRHTVNSLCAGQSRAKMTSVSVYKNVGLVDVMLLEDWFEHRSRN